MRQRNLSWLTVTCVEHRKVKWDAAIWHRAERVGVLVLTAFPSVWSKATGENRWKGRGGEERRGGEKGREGRWGKGRQGRKGRKKNEMTAVIFSDPYNWLKGMKDQRQLRGLEPWQTRLRPVLKGRRSRCSEDTELNTIIFFFFLRQSFITRNQLCYQCGITWRTAFLWQVGNLQRSVLTVHQSKNSRRTLIPVGFILNVILFWF